MKLDVIIFFDPYGNQDLENLNNSSHITELVSGGGRIWIQTILLVFTPVFSYTVLINPWSWVEAGIYFSFINQELKLPCAWVVESSGILNVLIKLLEVVQPCLQAAKEQKEVQTPKWVTLCLSCFHFCSLWYLGPWV